MNCKQGDLAIVVKSGAGNEGKIIKCLKFIGPVTYRWPKYGCLTFDSWLIDQRLPTFSGGSRDEFPDAWLKPLPPEDDVKSFDTTKELELVHGK